MSVKRFVSDILLIRWWITLLGVFVRAHAHTLFFTCVCGIDCSNDIEVASASLCFTNISNVWFNLHWFYMALQFNPTECYLLPVEFFFFCVHRCCCWSFYANFRHWLCNFVVARKNVETLLCWTTNHLRNDTLNAEMKRRLCSISILFPIFRSNFRKMCFWSLQQFFFIFFFWLSAKYFGKCSKIDWKKFIDEFKYSFQLISNNSNGWLFWKKVNFFRWIFITEIFFNSWIFKKKTYIAKKLHVNLMEDLIKNDLKFIEFKNVLVLRYLFSWKLWKP